MVCTLGACAGFGASPRGDRLARLKHSPRYDCAQGRFRNLYPRAPIRVVKALMHVFRSDAIRAPKAPLPVQRLRKETLAKTPRSGLRITWLGHSTMLIEIDGQRLLTDPVWSAHIGPVSGVGPERYYPVPIGITSLPRIDAVVISHDHYDHLDMASIEALLRAQPQLRFVVPLGVGAHLERWGVRPGRIVELDWWERTSIGGLTLVATPARHFSGRSLFDANTTLWASWAFLGPRHRVYFSGDGGYSPSVAEIGRRLGPFDVTLMESGAYGRFWTDVHMGPEQAVKAHAELGGKLMIPIHWGTFNLGPHGWTEPAERVLVAAAAAGARVAIPRPGQPVDAHSPPKVERWWPSNPWLSAARDPIVSSIAPLTPLRGSALVCRL